MTLPEQELPNNVVPENVLAPLLGEIISISKAAFTLDRDITLLDAETLAQDGKLTLITHETQQSCSSSDSIASLAEELSDTSGSANEIASNGVQAQKEFVRDLGHLQTVFAETGSFINNLKKESAEILELGSILEDIGQQLNILSINASIEAARSGASGKGFAVIAKEMRNLYRKVDSSAAAVGSIISNVIGGISTADANLQSAQNLLDASKQNAEKISGGLDELGTINSELSRKAGEISRLASAQIDINRTIDSLANDIGASSVTIRQKTDVSRANAQQVHSAVDATLISFSKFRFSWHEHAESNIRELSGELARNPGFGILERAFAGFPWFELFYVMDETGMQASANICNPSIHFSEDCKNAQGESRRDKEYFFLAAREEGKCIFSDIYISSATDSLCVTVSVAYRNGTKLFVLAGDINLDGIKSITP